MYNLFGKFFVIVVDDSGGKGIVSSDKDVAIKCLRCRYNAHIDFL